MKELKKELKLEDLIKLCCLMETISVDGNTIFRNGCYICVEKDESCINDRIINTLKCFENFKPIDLLTFKENDIRYFFEMHYSEYLILMNESLIMMHDQFKSILFNYLIQSLKVLEFNMYGFRSYEKYLSVSYSKVVSDYLDEFYFKDSRCSQSARIEKCIAKLDTFKFYKLEKKISFQP